MELHAIQNQILHKLVYSPKLRYSDLRPNDRVENNKLNFHISQLIDFGLIIKSNGTYQLTAKGKEYAVRINDESFKTLRQAKVSAFVCCIRDGEDEGEVLIYTRLKHPFYGCQGFMSGKVNYGEKIVEGAKRELFEEAGLTGNAKVVKVTHYRVYDESSRELLEDKIVFLCLIKNPTGEIVMSDEGKFEWVKKSNIADYITNPFETVELIIEWLEIADKFDGTIKLEEIDHVSAKF